MRSHADGGTRENPPAAREPREVVLTPARAAELRLKEHMILTGPEVAGLCASLPRGWTHSVLEALLSGEPLETLEVDAAASTYSFFDVKLRDGIDEAWQLPSNPDSWDPPAYKLIEVAKDRIVDAYPWLMDYMLGPCEGCGFERGGYFHADGTWRDLQPGDCCSLCGSEILNPRQCSACSEHSVRGPRLWAVPGVTDRSALCPHCGTAYDGSSPGWVETPVDCSGSKAIDP